LVSGTRDAARNGLLFAAIGTGFTGFGCLTGFGDQAFVLAGLGFLVAGLVFQGVTLDRARRLASESLALGIGGSGKTHLADGDEHPYPFTPGTWVVRFWSKDDPTQMLAQSPPVSGPSVKVLLRRCVDPAHVAAGAKVAPGDTGYHVDVL
jgi:hypothetical protein